MPTHILVTGDFIVDHHIYEGRRRHYGDRIEDGVRLAPQLGGAGLVHKVLSAIEQKKGLEDWRSHLAVDDPTALSGPTPGTTVSQPADQAYAFWRPFPLGASRESQFWRISEAMGFGAPWPSPGTTPQHTRWSPAPGVPTTPDVVVVSDGGADFKKSAPAWEREPFTGARWIVLKATSPVFGAAWRRLEAWSGKLVVIVAARDLRRSPVRISEGLSWEQTIQDVLRALVPGGGLAALSRCRHLIISFETEGALWFDLARQGEQPGLLPTTPVRFVYDAASIEGEHARAVEGQAYGMQSCLAAAVTREIAANLALPNITEGVDGGLCAMRDLREKGHGAATEQPTGFPVDRLAAALDRRPYVYSRASFRAGDPLADGWSLLQESQRAKGPAFHLARLVLLRGPIALANVPHVRIGAYLTPDRHEVESVRALAQLVRSYASQPASKPLSLGVFGPPGAGKSFAVRQLSTIVPKAKWLEFNLSQFSSPRELIGAFHQVRDHVLEGKLPVAFFDEFDSQGYLWLKHLLAPMQDGRFQEDQLIHPLGKCVMVFAGGTSRTFRTFGPPEPDQKAAEEPDAVRSFRLAKGPDFKSRLDGYLDVVGPNIRQLPVDGPTSPGAERADGWWFGLDPQDIHFPVRRALMVRAELKCKVDDKLEIDEGLVRALLRTARYAHGARSLGKVVQPLAAARPEAMRRSLLAPTRQLAMHVDAPAFLELCSAAPMEGPWQRLPPDTIDVMARATHDTYRGLGRREGWLRKDLDAEFDDLGEFHKNSNRAAADRMLKILALAGLRVEPGEATVENEEAVRTHLEYSLEALAEAEHDEWMEWHFSQGWRYAPKRDDEKQLHNCLRSYRQLPLVETGKDRDAIRHYPDVARTAEMKIVFV